MTPLAVELERDTLADETRVVCVSLVVLRWSVALTLHESDFSTLVSRLRSALRTDRRDLRHTFALPTLNLTVSPVKDRHP